MIVKKSYFILLSILCGCVAAPNFVSHTQEIDLEDFYAQNPNAKVFYESREQKDTIKLFRSWKDKELIIKKEGFKDYHIKLESVSTDDLWARDSKNGYMSSLWMLLPINVAVICSSIASDSGGGAGAGEAALMFAGICAAVTSPADVVNYSFLPMLPLWNPWKEYTAEELAKNKKSNADGKLRPTIILEPTEELKKSCDKDGYFISNLGCTECSYKNAVVALKAESDRCPNRLYGREAFPHYAEDLYYSYSCEDENLYYQEQDCLKCENRYDKGDGICRFCSGAVSANGQNCY